MLVYTPPTLNDLNEVVFLTGYKLYLWKSSFAVQELDLSNYPLKILLAFFNSGKILLQHSQTGINTLDFLDLRNPN